MNHPKDEQTGLSRRSFLGRGVLAATAASLGATNARAADDQSLLIEPFLGEHQSGILTPVQQHTYFAALDLVTTERNDVIKLLQQWTDAAAKMTAGQTAQPLGDDDSVPAPDSGDVLGLSPSRLTITFGFGPGLFVQDGKDRYGLAKHRPEALVDLPKFTGDQLQDSRSGGDLSIQACADDPQVAFHAIRQLSRLSYNIAAIRWVQTGFNASFKPDETPRNLMGFKDGTNNPSIKDPNAMDKVIWVGEEGPNWMQRGSYMVVRKIRIALEHWDRMNVAFQEQTMGRCKYSGAPLGGKTEFEKANYDAVDKDGNPTIPENAHMRLAAAAHNDGAQILRRAFSYNDGANFTAERWPPWRQEMEYDAGLFFICYQRDPRAGFIKLFEKMSKFDMMNQFVTHVGSGIFACPAGIKQGEYVGQRLFEQ